MAPLGWRSLLCMPFRAALWDIQRAILARRIMLNDPSVFENGWPSGVPMPYIIWWPLRPDPEMLSLLATEVPEMKRQVAAAAIACDYEEIYKYLDPEPSWHLWKVASMYSTNPFYREDQERRGREENVDVEDDTYMESYYRQMVETREFTVLDGYSGKIRDSVQKHKIPELGENILSTSAVQLKVWESIGKVSPE